MTLLATLTSLRSIKHTFPSACGFVPETVGATALEEACGTKLVRSRDDTDGASCDAPLEVTWGDGTVVLCGSAATVVAAVTRASRKLKVFEDMVVGTSRLAG